MNDTERELLEVNQRLLDSIAEGDWKVYAQLCDAGLTAFEPEARGHLIDGMEFHQFYFDNGGHMGPHRAEIVEPRVRMLGDSAAVVTYVRIVQRASAGRAQETLSYEETRVWQRQEGQWRHVHFHRSAAT